MSNNQDLSDIKATLLDRIANTDQPRTVLRAPELRDLYAKIREADDKAAYGAAINSLKQELEAAIVQKEELASAIDLPPIDVTAPMDSNTDAPSLLPSHLGSKHPINTEIAYMSDILGRMGFHVYESREIDDQFHMFESLNFPKGHPARDDYDTFMTVDVDSQGESFIAPAHTSTMQNRILVELKDGLEKGEAIAAASIDRVFRNEDLDARHEHTFYQHEGIYVSKGVNVGNLVATLQAFLEEYFNKPIKARINPFYFPFTEPSFEFSLSCPFCDGSGVDCKVCAEGWIELLGCGMIHPNVLKAADIDPAVYTGFAWGGGVERLIMMKYQIEDIRHFHSAKLDFLRQF